MFKTIALFVAGLIVVMTGCDNGETGYVQLRVMPANATVSTELYLDGVRLDFSRGPTVTLQFKTGRLTLTAIGSSWAPALCNIVVRKDRISALTVMAAQTPAKCVCEIRATESDANAVVCT
jgi:hypothetical protein